MKSGKLNLEIDQLHVESFETDAPAAARGTVIGNAITPLCTQYDRTCNGYGTCGIYPCRPIP